MTNNEMNDDGADRYTWETDGTGKLWAVDLPQGHDYQATRGRLKDLRDQGLAEIRESWISEEHRGS